MEKAEEILKSKAVPHEVFFTREKGHALRLTKEILSGTNQDTRVIAVGGDGTINEMINGAIDFLTLSSAPLRLDPAMIM